MIKNSLPFVLVLLLSGTALSPGQSHPPADSQVKQRLKNFVEKNKRAPGIVVGLIDEKGSRVLAYGNRGTDQASSVDGDTVFEIGSATKVFTTLLLQEMVDRNEVKLDDPIGKFLPPSVKSPSRNGKQITLLDLATQSSGLPRLPDNLMGLRTLMHLDNPYADYTPEKLYEFLASYKLTRDIGSKYEYSNLGMGLLGHVLALKARTNYEALVITRICDPLKMNSTRITLSPELKSRLATGHNAKGKPVSNWDFQTIEGCGALRSTVNDMLKFLAVNMGIDPCSIADAAVKTHIPLRDADLGQRIGLGWHTSTAGIIWHNGGTGGYRSYVGFSPRTHRGVVVLCNSANDVDDLALEILGPAREHQLAKVDPLIYTNYVGKYQLAPGATLTITSEGEKFFAQLTGQEKIEFFPESEADFFCNVVDAQLTFVKDAAGAVTAVVLHQGGYDQKAKKLQ